MSSEVVGSSKRGPLLVVKPSKEVVFFESLCSEGPPIPALAVVHLPGLLLPVRGHCWPVDLLDKSLSITKKLRKDSSPFAQLLIVTLAVLKALEDNLLCGPSGAHHRAALVESPDVLEAGRRHFDEVLKGDQSLLFRGRA